ncbi:DUF1599 domain-containing protein [Ornithobacterium rhinotracheale]|uniref:DUF1599 domain-containing protein n=1 Tax=Ornithobacterium rhinotracheale TaxID=28251 RepID=UPI00129C49FF|nr:DUF1599 domain-containing protein [Ornithobacterium rhinotracheale]MRI64112.1 DUF1599 domain-containing protein [Ornithobacterium rhinotracheale]
MEKTLQQYDQALAMCRNLFEKKLKDYGASWRILRMASVTDQIFIKANRIRNIQETTERKVNESEESEFIAIVNYSIIALIQLSKGAVVQPDMSADEAMVLYDQYAREARDLMERKNHDYGEVWRDMRISSITDLILQKILRVKQIEDNQGKTVVSEGLDANYLDMLNYAIFSLIKLNEKA